MRHRSRHLLTGALAALTALAALGGCTGDTSASSAATTSVVVHLDPPAADPGAQVTAPPPARPERTPPTGYGVAGFLTRSPCVASKLGTCDQPAAVTAGEVVVVNDETNAEVARAATDPEGWFAIALAQGAYRLEATAPGAGTCPPVDVGVTTNSGYVGVEIVCAAPA